MLNVVKIATQGSISPLYDMGPRSHTRKPKPKPINLNPNIDNKHEGLLMLMYKGETYEEVNPDLHSVFRLACHNLNVKMNDIAFQTIRKGTVLTVYKLI